METIVAGLLSKAWQCKGIQEMDQGQIYTLTRETVRHERSERSADDTLDAAFSAAGSILSIAIAPFVLAAFWVILAWLSAIVRPVAGVILYVATYYLMTIAMITGHNISAFPQTMIEDGSIIHFLLVASLCALIAAIAFLLFGTQIVLMSVESIEGILISKLMGLSMVAGRVAHLALYFCTAALPLFILCTPVFFSDENKPLEPRDICLCLISGGILSIIALRVRYQKHPFASQLTLLGNPRH